MCNFPFKSQLLGKSQQLLRHHNAQRCVLPVSFPVDLLLWQQKENWQNTSLCNDLFSIVSIGKCPVSGNQNEIIWNFSIKKFNQEDAHKVRQLCLQRDSRDSFLAELMFWTLYFHKQNDNKLAFFWEKSWKLVLFYSGTLPS